MGVQEAATLIQHARLGSIERFFGHLTRNQHSYCGYCCTEAELRNGYIGEGGQLTSQAWNSMLELGTKMTSVYQGQAVGREGYVSDESMIKITQRP